MIWEKIKPNWKKWGFRLQLWDGIWSIPLAFLLFIAYGYAGEWYFQNEDGSSDFGAMMPSFFHPVIFAMLVIVALNTISWFGIQFNFKGVWLYYTTDAKTDFKALEPWQKIKLLIFLYLVFFVAGLLIVLNFSLPA